MGTMWKVGDVVVPGDILTDLKESEASGKTILGPGLRRESESIVVVKPGVLKFKEPNFYWIDSHQKRVNTILIMHSIVRPS